MTLAFLEQFTGIFVIVRNFFCNIFVSVHPGYKLDFNLSFVFNYLGHLSCCNFQTSRSITHRSIYVVHYYGNYENFGHIMHEYAIRFIGTEMAFHLFIFCLWLWTTIVCRVFVSEAKWIWSFRIWLDASCRSRNRRFRCILRCNSTLFHMHRRNVTNQSISLYFD